MGGMNLPLKKACPECDGVGRLHTSTKDLLDLDDSGMLKTVKCSTCEGTGEVWNYLTPRQWEAVTKLKVLESDPVWCKMHAEEPWKLSEYRFDDGYHWFIMAIAGQPKPPEDMLYE